MEFPTSLVLAQESSKTKTLWNKKLKTLTRDSAKPEIINGKLLECGPNTVMVWIISSTCNQLKPKEMFQSIFIPTERANPPSLILSHRSKNLQLYMPLPKPSKLKNPLKKLPPFLLLKKSTSLGAQKRSAAFWILLWSSGKSTNYMISSITISLMPAIIWKAQVATKLNYRHWFSATTKKLKSLFWPNLVLFLQKKS